MPRTTGSSVLRHLKANLTIAELSGAFGDLGTFLPLMLAMVKHNHLDFGTTLIVTGIYNIVSGVHFRIPMCVQPMKTIAAVAISSHTFTNNQVMLAGAFVSLVVLILGVTRLIDYFNYLIPMPIVRGIQLAVGMNLAMKGITSCFMVAAKAADGSKQMQWRQWLGVDGVLLAVVGLVFCLVTTIPPTTGQATALEAFLYPLPTPSVPAEEHSASDERQDVSNELDAEASAGAVQHWSSSLQPQAQVAAEEPLLSQSLATAPGCCSTHGQLLRVVPSALVVLLIGIVIALVNEPDIARHLRWGPSTPHIVNPNWHDLQEGILKAGLAQLPLTTLNSVIAVSQLAAELFPTRSPAAFRPSLIAMSVGAMNLAGCWFGAMPCCHGAGGLAAQVKFGASSGAAPALLGISKIILGLVFGSSLAVLLSAFPETLLGALLVVSGVELASAARKEVTARGAGLMLLTAASIMAFNDTGYGFAFGFLSYLAVVLAEYGGLACGWFVVVLKRHGLWFSNGRCVSK